MNECWVCRDEEDEFILVSSRGKAKGWIEQQLDWLNEQYEELEVLELEDYFGVLTPLENALVAAWRETIN